MKLIAVTAAAAVLCGAKGVSDPANELSSTPKGAPRGRTGRKDGKRDQSTAGAVEVYSVQPHYLCLRETNIVSQFSQHRHTSRIVYCQDYLKNDTLQSRYNTNANLSLLWRRE